MSLVQKSSQGDKQRNGVYQVLDAFIRENMLRRIFSLRRPKLEEKETTEELQKENVHPNSQNIKRAVEPGQTKHDILTAEPDSSAKTTLNEINEAETTCDPPCDKLDDEDKELTQERSIPDLCLTLETSTVSDAESQCFSEMKDCESIKDEVSVSDESDRCESSTSGEDRNESGIEQDFDPKTDEKLVNSNIEHSTTELKKELESPVQIPESTPMPLVPINLKSHLKRNDRIKTLNRSSKGIPGTIDHNRSSCESSPEKSPSFIPLNSNKKQSSSYRPEHTRRPLVITTARQPRRKKVPEMFGDIISKDRLRTRAQFQSPVRKGILKNPNSSRLAFTGVKYATTQKRNKRISSKEKTNSTSSDSGLSDGEGSSGEEQKRMPVKKIFSNQQALRKKIDDLNGMLKTMAQQKAELQAVLRIIEDWSEDLRSVDRTNLGVPYIRAVKQTLAKQRVALNSKKSDFNRRITNLKDAEVPFHEEFSNLIQQLRKEITYVVRDQRKYSARSVENIRQLQGRVIGTCSAILAVYYEG